MTVKKLDLKSPEHTTEVHASSSLRTTEMVGGPSELSWLTLSSMKTWADFV